MRRDSDHSISPDISSFYRPPFYGIGIAWKAVNIRVDAMGIRRDWSSHNTDDKQFFGQVIRITLGFRIHRGRMCGRSEQKGRL